jgi:hypothetical protein
VRARTSLKPHHCVHVRLISLTCSLRSYSKYLMIRRRQRRARYRGSTEIRPCELMSSWIYNEKFPTGMQFLFKTSSFTAAHGDDLEHPTHEQEARHTTTIGFEFSRSLKNSATTFQVAVRQPATIDPIDGLTRPPIETSSTTIRSSGLALTEIRTIKSEE